MLSALCSGKQFRTSVSIHSGYSSDFGYFAVKNFRLRPCKNPIMLIRFYQWLRIRFRGASAFSAPSALANGHIPG